jgi:hypothetical protein
MFFGAGQALFIPGLREDSGKRESVLQGRRQAAGKLTLQAPANPCTKHAAML